MEERGKNSVNRHSCKQCKFSATTEENFIEHQRIIHEGFRYACDVCEFVSKKSSLVNEHREYVHEGKKVKKKDDQDVIYIGINPKDLDLFRKRFEADFDCKFPMNNILSHKSDEQNQPCVDHCHARVT